MPAARAVTANTMEWPNFIPDHSHWVALAALALFIALQLRPAPRIAPGPPRVPILGSLPWMRRERHLLDQAPLWRDRYHSGLIQVAFGMANVLLVTKVKDARQLLYGSSTEHRPKLILTHDELRPALWLGPVVAADAWVLATRRITVRLAKLAGQEAGMHGTTVMLEWLSRNCSGRCCLAELVHHFSLANAVDSAWGARLNTAEEVQGITELGRLIALGHLMMLSFDPSQDLTFAFPLLKWMLPWQARTQKRRAQRLYTDWEATVKSLGTRLREMGASNAVSQSSLAGEDRDYEMTPDELDYQGALILVGTLDTIHSTTLLSLAALTHLRQAQGEIREEIRGLVAQGHKTCSSPRLVAFVRETLRLYPFAATGFPRKLNEPIVTEGDPRTVIPKGKIVIPLTMTLGRDKEYWGEDAEEHNYHRFLDKAGQLKPQAFPSFGFGFGRRSCPGHRMAETMMSNAIGSLLLSYELYFELRDAGTSKEDSMPALTGDETRARSKDGLKEALRVQFRGNAFKMDLAPCVIRPLA
ncbi:unnamed protein product [Parajaminaea phylloscopi]